MKNRTAFLLYLIVFFLVSAIVAPVLIDKEELNEEEWKTYEEETVHPSFELVKLLPGLVVLSALVVWATPYAKAFHNRFRGGSDG